MGAGGLPVEQQRQAASVAAATPPAPLVDAGLGGAVLLGVQPVGWGVLGRSFGSEVGVALARLTVLLVLLVVLVGLVVVLVGLVVRDVAVVEGVQVEVQSVVGGDHHRRAALQRRSVQRPGRCLSPSLVSVVLDRGALPPLGALPGLAVGAVVAGDCRIAVFRPQACREGVEGVL